MDSLKIGIIHMGFFYSGGGEKTVLNQARYLQEMGHDVEVLAPIIRKNCFPQLMTKVKSYEVVDWLPDIVPLKPAISLVAASTYIAYDRIAQNDIIIAHGQPSNWIAYKTRKKTGMDYYAYLHQVNRFQRPRKVDLESKWGPDNNIKILSLLNQNNSIIEHLDRKSICSSSGIITNSKWIQNQIREYYHCESSLCYPGIEMQNIEANDKDSLTILTTNRHFPQKRIAQLLDVFKQVLKKKPEATCIITGAPTNHTKTLQEKCHQLKIEKKVHFTGLLSNLELEKKYSEARVYAFTSPEEDLGLGPLEAGAGGTPSVVWDHAGPRETVIDGVTGYRIKPYFEEKMADQIVELLNDPKKAKKMGKLAHQLVKSQFSWKKHCEKLSKIITSCKTPE